MLWTCRRNGGVFPSLRNTGDGAAEKRLKALNTEAAHINLDIENVRSAIDEAKRRLAAAERDEAMAAARENAEAALVIGNRLLERAAKIDAALATAREEMLAYKRDVDALHLTGCAAPTGQQFLTFGGLAVTAFTMQLPVKVDRDFLAPRERRTFTELTSSWRDGVASWAARLSSIRRPRDGEGRDHGTLGRGGVPEGDADCRDGDATASALRDLVPCTKNCARLDNSLLRGASGSRPPTRCFALAWNGLSLSDQAQIRDEEIRRISGRQAEEARLREIIYARRWARRRETNNETRTSWHFAEGSPRRLCRRRSDEVRARGSCCGGAQRLRDSHRGRDGLKDIASIPATTPTWSRISPKQTLVTPLRWSILEGQGCRALRKVNPSLTRMQAFSRVYTDPSNAEIAKIERAANEARFAGAGDLLIHRR